MDPVAHTFTGAALAAAGLRRATPLATAALLLGANAPDVDVVAYFAGGFEALAFRRGWTHGVLALALWPFVLAGALLAWDQRVRRRRDPTAAPARAGPLLAVSAVAVVTHPALDWLNNYGLRWLMPFDGRWFYGDAVFIIDPWLWLVLGGVTFLAFSQSGLARIAWAALALLATALILVNAQMVPPLSLVLWLVGVTTLAVTRWRWRAASPASLERVARFALGAGGVYVVAMVAASAAARTYIRDTLAADGVVAEAVMVAPAAADPFGGAVVVMTRDEYRTGTFSWLAEPRLALRQERIERPRGPVFEAAAATPDARNYLTWSRFPAVAIESTADAGTLVRFFDVRYIDGARLSGPTVRLDRELKPVRAD